MKRKERAAILEKCFLAEDIVSMTLEVSFAEEVRAGQFVSLFTGNAARLLPRPISVADADPEAGSIRLVFRLAGAGTREIADLPAGGGISVLGPLGNGFPLAEAAGRRVVLASGGIGIPPMVLTARQLMALPSGERPREVIQAAGYRNADAFLLEELRESAGDGQVLVATDDGSLGVRGTVLDALREADPGEDLIFSCGPLPMLRALKLYALEKDLPLYVSMEERMACGVGVCLGCVTETAEIDPHSGVRSARVCTDGPVFDARKVTLGL